MKKEPLVSIYIPCKDYGEYLSNAIDSVVNQVYTNWELIIINEGSNDNTSKIARSYQKKYPNQISLIEHNKPIGLQKVANKVLDIAKGKYVVRLDADDWFHELALFAMVSKIEENPKAGIIYGNYFYTNEDGKILGIESRPQLGKEDLVGHLPPHGACTLFDKKILINEGGYFEEVDAQDGWDLWYKLFKKVEAISLDLPLFYYRQHEKSLSKDNNRLLNARAKIFEKIRKKSPQQTSPIVVAVLPVKESYPNLKNVPYKTINGRSLLEIAISNALMSDQINDLIISSESQRVLNFSKELEIKKLVPKHQRILRKNISSRNIPITDFLISASKHFKNVNGKYPDILVYLSLHAINRRAEHIDQAINNLIISESDSVVSVQEEREPMFNYKESGLNLINPGRFKDLSFDKERLYRFNGSIIASLWNNISKNNLFGQKTSFIEMNHNDSIQTKDNSLFD